MPIVLAGSAREDFEINFNTTTFVASGGPTDIRLAPEMNEGLYMTAQGAYAKTRFKAPIKNYWLTFHISISERVFSTASTNVYIGKTSLWPLGVTTPLRLRFSRGINNAANGVQLYVNGAGQGYQAVELPSANQSVRYDLHVVNDATTGLVELYADGILISQFTGDTSLGLANHDYIIMDNAEDNTAVVYSSIIVTSSDVRLFRMKPMPVEDDGTFQEWIGDYTDINEAGLDLGTFIETNTPGAVSTFEFTKPTTPVGYQIAGIVLNSNASIYGPLATDIIPVYYDGVDVVDLPAYNVDDVVFGGNMLIAEVDPATGLRFTTEQLATLEFGFKLPEAP